MKLMIMSSIILGLMYYWPMKNLDVNSLKKDSIHVYVQGEVIECKSIKLDKYSTLNDVLKYISLTDEADISSLNPMMVVKDGDTIVIPKKSEVQKISINYGTFEELLSIPGIGESKAIKIIEYRKTYGLFQTLDDLMKIDGIKQKTFDKLKEFICL